jgi:hypothetical protein
MKRMRVLCLDGSGVYGLIEARLLRGLCERDPEFLSPGNIDLIAGCSAGSINTLVMATEESPRDLLLDGTVEKMWKDTQEWADDSMMMNIGVMFGMTPFFTRTTTYSMMDKHFGKKRMRDLKQKVLISIFNWHGNEDHSELADWPELEKKPFLVNAMEAYQQNLKDIKNASRRGEQTGYRGDKLWNFRRWGPTHFTNMGDGPEQDYYVSNVGYVAQTPPVARPYHFGLGDGASGNLSPAGLAFSWMFDHLRDKHGKAAPVDAISVLSVGDGAIIPFHWEKQSYFNGAKWFQKWPSNPQMGAWSTPSDYQFQGSAEEDRFFRLNPGLMHRPMVASTYSCGTPSGRDKVFKEIDEAFKTRTASDAMDQAAEFLLSDRWTQDRI